MRQLFRVLIGVLVCAAGLSSAVAGNDEATIVITGSERMAPLIKRLAEHYTEFHPQVKIEVNGGGSSAGVPALLSGTATIAALARPLTDQEIRRARRDLGKQLPGTPIAMDAVGLIVRPDNPATSLTIEQAGAIFTYRVTEWSQLGVDILESSAEERARRRRHARSKGPLINRHLPAPESGTVQVVQSRVLQGKAFGRGGAEYDSRRELVHAVGADPYGIGLCGLGYTSGVKVLALRQNAESPAVAPTPQTIRDRSYPLAHYLYFYFAGQPSGPAKDFLAFVLSAEGQRIIDHPDSGAVALPFGPGNSENPPEGSAPDS